MKPYIVIKMVAINWGNRLLPHVTKPIPEQTLTHYQWVLTAFTRAHFRNAHYLSLTCVWKLQPDLPRVNRPIIRVLSVSQTEYTDMVIYGHTVYPKKYARGFYFAALCFGYTLTDFPISSRLTSLALWQYNDCPSASKATLMNMDKYFMWIHYERLHDHNKAKHNETVCIFLGI